MKKKLFVIVLSVIMAFACLTACSESSSTAESQTSKASSAYSLPDGADSEYELYKTVTNYLNSGFHFDDLKDVCDPALTIAFKSKREEKTSNNFTAGLKYDEASELISKLRKTADSIDLSKGGAAAMTDDDYSQFEKQYPESMQQQIKDNYKKFKTFVQELIVAPTLNKTPFNAMDGTNPLDNDNTKWETVPESELKTEEFKESADLTDTFPTINEISLGTYKSEYTYEMGYYSVNIGGKYYLLDFSEVVI